VRILTNPVFIRMATVLLSAVGAFVAGIVGIRMLRRGIVDAGAMPLSSAPEAAIPLHTSAVIQQLKQQKFALQTEQQVEKRRSKTSEHITAAIIANLPCGLLFVAPNGLVKQANPAARQLLGFASPLGMSVNELFRNVMAIGKSGEEGTVSQAFDSAMSKGQAQHFESPFCTPGGEEHTLRLKLVPVGAPGEILGTVVVITDLSEMTSIHRGELLRAETSAEMALELRTSLSSIREWAARMKGADDPQQRRDLAQDVCAEAEHLEKAVGKFLAGEKRSQAAGA
jgi:PAS domain-containing protein